jgi:hypothetical protein
MKRIEAIDLVILLIMYVVALVSVVIILEAGSAMSNLVYAAYTIAMHNLVP